MSENIPQGPEKRLTPTEQWHLELGEAAVPVIEGYLESKPDNGDESAVAQQMIHQFSTLIELGLNAADLKERQDQKDARKAEFEALNESGQ